MEEPVVTLEELRRKIAEIVAGSNSIEESELIQAVKDFYIREGLSVDDEFYTLFGMALAQAEMSHEIVPVYERVRTGFRPPNPQAFLEDLVRRHHQGL